MNLLSKLQKGDCLIVRNPPFTIPLIAQVIYANALAGVVRARINNGTPIYYEIDDIVVALRPQENGFEQLQP